jgi:hypothetical protein
VINALKVIFKIFAVIALITAFAILSVAAGLYWEYLAFEAGCGDKPCPWGFLPQYFVVPWFGPLIGAYGGEDGYDAMTVEVMINFFLFFMVCWLLILFLRRKRRLADQK